MWVDNVLYSDDRARVVQADIERFKRACVACNVTIKIEELLDKPQQQVTFVGMDIDHQRRTVAVAEKTRSKLPRDECPATIAAGDLEKLIGRLIFAAGVCNLPLVNYYFVMKWCKRVFNKLNNGTMHPTNILDFNKAPAVRHELTKWISSAHETSQVSSARPGRTAHLFVDATRKGWGAVLILPNNNVITIGGAFDEEIEINFAEMLSIELALLEFKETLFDPKSGISHVVIHSDNTSVENNVRRGMCGADGLVEPLRAILLRFRNSTVSFDIVRVATTRNAADKPSRQQVVTDQDLRNAREEIAIYERQGAGGLARQSVLLHS